MVKVIATDLDGTLLKPIKKLTLVEKENAKYARDFYGDIVLVSGRSPKFCAKICNKLKIEHNFIALNGAVIVKNGNVLYRQSMKKTILVELQKELENNYSDYEMVIFDKYDKITSYSPSNKITTIKKHIKHFLKYGRLHSYISISNKKFFSILNDLTPIYKSIIYSKDCCEDIGNFLKNKFGKHFEFFVSGHSIEIAPLGINKGQSLKYLIDSTNVKNEEVFVVGDGINDISMFEVFSNSFAINNDNSYLKSKAKYIINKFSDLEKYTRVNKNFH